jgi:mono/diheme cytochrome c family protein
MARIHAVAAFCAFAILVGPLRAQESGAVLTGHLVAQRLCAECHAVERRQVRSPARSAPTFEAVAAISGMTPMALRVALATSHRTMPNVMLPPDELSDVVTYILSLQPDR